MTIVSSRALRKAFRRVSVLCGLLLPLAAFAAEGHPLIEGYQGAGARKTTVQEFAEYSLVAGIDKESGTHQVTPLEGRVTRVEYANPKDRSHLEIFRNYQQALEGAGMRALFRCKDLDCGNTYALRRWPNGFRVNGKEVYALAGQLEHGGRTAYVALMVNMYGTFADVIELQEMETGLVQVNADALLAGLERDGRVVVPGILFDTGKATIKTESKAALDEMAKLLAANPGLKVYIVGHTDSQGALAFNLRLSRERAAAVSEALVSDYGAAAERLDPHGVGPLAPAASNASGGGRAQNRRVELVVQ